MAADYHFRNLVFEGGGVRGIAYVGVIRELRKRGILQRIERVAGTSAGAINAVLLVTGYKQRETTNLLLDLDFRNFLDDSWGLVRDSRRLIRNFGWYKGDFFRDWIGKRIAEKTGNADASFDDFRGIGLRDLYLIATNLSTGLSEVMSAEHTPDMPVADAVRMSMSIPLFFQAIQSEKRDVLVDGGVLMNYPIKVFDRKKYIKPGNIRKHALDTDYYKRDNKSIRSTASPFVYNKETLGFRLDTRDEISLFRDGRPAQTAEIDNFFNYGWALVKAALNVRDNVHLHSDDWQRTVYVDTLGVGSTDFEVSAKTKRKLITSGAKGVTQYFDWYDSARGRSLPHNHPGFKLR